MKIIYFLIAFLMVGFVSAWIVAGKLVALVPANTENSKLNLPAVSFELKSESGSILSGWDIQHSSAKGVVLLFHGIRSNRLSMLKRAEMLYRHGYSSVLIDFQAHGLSPGEHITIG